MTNQPATPIAKEYISCADTAKELRKALKAAFPTITFSVRSKTYSGGASITVGWTDGPTSNIVDRVAKQFAGASFDGSIDLKSYHASEYEGRRVHWGADFVFTNRHCSDAHVERAIRYVENRFGIEIERASWQRSTIRIGDRWASDEIWSTAARMRGDGLMILDLR